VQKLVKAKFVRGVFEPVEPVDGIEENRQVTVIIEVPDRRPPLDGWVGGLSDEDARAMLKEVEAEFEQINPDDWK
jgi:hypothetical protein